MIETVADIERELQSLETKKKALEKSLEVARQLQVTGPEYDLAIFLHSKFCHGNHTDGCSWYYAVKDGMHDWSDYAHEEYLKKARLVLGCCNRMHLEPEMAKEIISAVA